MGRSLFSVLELPEVAQSPLRVESVVGEVRDRRTYSMAGFSSVSTS